MVWISALTPARESVPRSPSTAPLSSAAGLIGSTYLVRRMSRASITRPASAACAGGAAASGASAPTLSSRMIARTRGLLRARLLAPISDGGTDRHQPDQPRIEREEHIGHHGGSHDQQEDPTDRSHNPGVAAQPAHRIERRRHQYRGHQEGQTQTQRVREEQDRARRYRD